MPIAIAAFVASALFTALVRCYLLRRRVLDIPNERSSHFVAVPRGGGASIVVVFLLTELWLAQKSVISGGMASALAGGGLLIAAAGWLDDHFGLPARLRLLIHFVAAAWALWQLNGNDGMPPLHLGWTTWDWGSVGQFVGLIGLVWMTNLYNFMDGIDGIAGVEAVCVGGLGGLLLAWVGLGGIAAGALALMGASAGFLVWNWPPAKIFMGDVGSGFLGFVFGVLAIASARERPWLLWPWLILLSVFIVDSTVTLMRRFVAGERWYEAHCSHAYQHAARSWGSHSKVTLAVAAINVIWLFPLAMGACVWPVAGPLFAVAALVPLVCTALRYGAGRGTPAAEGAYPKAEIGAVADAPNRQNA